MAIAEWPLQSGHCTICMSTRVYHFTALVGKGVIGRSHSIPGLQVTMIM